jgi:hypothetical protein
MIFFNRLRASASTWSFHLAVLHSGPSVFVLERDGVGPRLAWEESTWS